MTLAQGPPRAVAGTTSYLILTPAPLKSGGREADAFKMKSRNWKGSVQDSNSHLARVDIFLKITPTASPSACNLALAGLVLPLRGYFAMSGVISDRCNLG